jgi:hypothetical protein
MSFHSVSFLLINSIRTEVVPILVLSFIAAKIQLWPMTESMENPDRIRINPRYIHGDTKMNLKGTARRMDSSDNTKASDGLLGTL